MGNEGAIADSRTESENVQKDSVYPPNLVGYAEIFSLKRSWAENVSEFVW